MDSIAKVCLTSGLLMCLLAASPVNGEDDAEGEKVIVDEARTLLNWRTDSIRFFVCQYDLSNVDSLSSVLSDDAGTEIKRLLRLASGEDSSDLPGRRTLPPRVDGFDEVKDALKNCSAQSAGSLPTSLHKEIKDHIRQIDKGVTGITKVFHEWSGIILQRSGRCSHSRGFEQEGRFCITNTNSCCRAHLHQRLFLRIELSSESK